MAEEKTETRSSSRRGLGKGLGALITNTDPEREIKVTGNIELEAGVQHIRIADIDPNPQQPRSAFDPEALAELAASIREHGVIQPLVVTRNLDQPGRYWLITGERRLRASQLADLDSVPAIIREATSRQLLELALVENVQRADLNPLEEAAAYQMLVERFSLTQEEVAQRVARSRSAVANTIRLLQLPSEVQQALINGQITPGHARAILSLADDELRVEALRRIVARDLNVRQAEEFAKHLSQPKPDPDPTAPRDVSVQDAHIQFLEDRFRSALGTRVNLNRNKDGSGRLVVHFYNDEDLESLYRQIAAAEDE